MAPSKEPENRALCAVKAFFNDHKGVRRLFVLWSLITSSFAIWATYMIVPEITGAVATTLASVLALVNAPTAYYFKIRADEEGRK